MAARVIAVRRAIGSVCAGGERSPRAGCRGESVSFLLLVVSLLFVLEDVADDGA